MVDENATDARPPRQAFTIPEFCAMWGCSVATYHRRRAKGLTPTETMRWDRPMITQEDLDIWKAALQRREPPEPPPPLVVVTPGSEDGRRRRARRPPTVATGKRREDVFDPPLPKAKRRARPQRHPV